MHASPDRNCSTPGRVGASGRRHKSAQQRNVLFLFCFCFSLDVRAIGAYTLEMPLHGQPCNFASDGFRTLAYSGSLCSMAVGAFDTNAHRSPLMPSASCQTSNPNRALVRKMIWMSESATSREEYSQPGRDCPRIRLRSCEVILLAVYCRSLTNGRCEQRIICLQKTALR